MRVWIPFLNLDDFEIPDEFDESKEIGFFEYELKKESEENEGVLNS